MSEASKLHIRSWAELCNDVDLRDYFTVYIQVFLLSLDFDIFAFCSDISKQTRRKLKTKIWGKINFSYKPSFENLTFKLNKKKIIFLRFYWKIKRIVVCMLNFIDFIIYNENFQGESRDWHVFEIPQKKCKQLFLKIFQKLFRFCFCIQKPMVWLVLTLNAHFPFHLTVGGYRWALYSFCRLLTASDLCDRNEG